MRRSSSDNGSITESSPASSPESAWRYRGWYIVGIALLANMLVTGATHSSFGLFVLPVSDEYQLSRANINTAMILLSFGTAVLAPILGRMLDKFPPARIMLACAVLFGASFICLGGVRSVPLSALVVTVMLAVGVQGSGSLTTTVLIARWFSAQRGRAMAIALMGMSLGTLVVPPLVGLSIDRYGWRETLLLMGGVGGTLLASLALVVGALHAPSRTQGSPSKTAATAKASLLSVTAILRMAHFWLLAVSAALALGIAQTLMITLVPLAQQANLTTLQATTLLSITGAAAFGTKILLAVIGDRVDRVLLLSAVFLCGALLNAALLLSDSYMLLAACAVALGVQIGGLAPVFFALLADRFGAASFGTVRGLAVPITGIVGAISVRLAGEVFDRTGSYDVLFVSFIAAEIAAAILMFATRIVPPPAHLQRRPVGGANVA